jgi:glycosyltransferase involved in cell wall biosynthesis
VLWNFGNFRVDQMTLWFDVTDLSLWGGGHLTGIQRTSVNVLSELMAARQDIQLFVYYPSEKVLRKINVSSLPTIIREGVISTRGLDTKTFGDHPHGTAIATSNVFSVARESITIRCRNLRSSLRRQPRKWVGDEMMDATKEFLRSSLNLLRKMRRKLFGESRTAESPTPVRVPPESILFKRGDVCLSLSATWGLPHYGDVITANTSANGAKCINMIYDLIPTLFPQWVLPGHSQMITLWARRQIENADVVLTISKFQKEEISRYILADKLPDRTIEVIHLGDNPKLVAATAADASLPLPRYVPKRKFVICVSTLDVRKNHRLLYNVWCRLADELGPDCPQLLLIGAPHLHVSDLLYQIHNDRLVNRLIIHLHDATDEELAWYYRHCQFTVYPSMYEGWGLPISESLSLGKYCIAGNKTSLPEAGGDLVDYFDPLDFVGCYKLVYKAVTDPDYVEQYERRIRASYVPHTWTMAAAHISEIVDRIADSGQREAV